MAKDWKDRLGMVYSTNDDYDYDKGGEDEESIEKSKQKLYISLDKKNRKGKAVTLIEGFMGPEEELKDLGKMLKSKCGVGGSAKDSEILIQGDVRDKVVVILEKEGYTVKRKGGY